MICPFCGDDIDARKYVPSSMGHIYRLAGSDTAFALYRHLLMSECTAPPIVCPVCDITFIPFAEGPSMRMRFARHWCRYAGMTKQEHVIASAMGEE